MDEMIRFNEAIDQAIAESVSTFADKAGEARDVFLAMLGHDLRSPLSAIGLTSEYFERPEVDITRRISSARRIKRSVASMAVMVNDLLEFSRLQLGGTIPVIRVDCDLVEICERAVDDARTAHPACTFELEAPPALAGAFDADRLGQVLGNLLNNAARYRTRGTPVTLAVATDGDEAVMTVHNFGPAIPEEARESIFQPLVQLKSPEQGAEHARSSVGLGLFIARQMVQAHGGSLGVASSKETGTSFSARLPRRTAHAADHDTGPRPARVPQSFHGLDVEATPDGTRVG
jgi:signal transduction histidine kinase